MLLGCVIGDEIEDDLQSEGMCFAQQRFEIRHGAEQRLNFAVVRYVVAEIGHWRREDWRNPDCANAELGQVAEPCPDSVDVANAIAVRVLKRPRIDLVDYPALPPLRLM